MSAARFTVLDEASTAQLLDRLTLDVLLQAAAAPDSALGKALAAAIVVAADQTFKDVVGDAIKERDAIAAWIERAGGIEQAIAGLSQSFGLEPDDSAESVEQEYFRSFAHSGSGMAGADRGARRRLGQRQEPHRRRCRPRAHAHRPRAHRRSICKMFCTAELEPRKNMRHQERSPSAIPTGSRALHAEQDRVCALLARERALAARDRTGALVTIAKEVIDRYRAREGAARAARLRRPDRQDAGAVSRRVAAAWVLYKLDLGIDHILIDEAQDTSPKQWEIIRAIASEFMPGGARPNVKRTLFAVGDEKQSIFSFQGAAPRAFDEMRRVVRASVHRAGAGLAASALPSFVPLRRQCAGLGRPRVHARATSM